MNEEIDEIKQIIDDWYSFKLNLSVADIMPYLVFLLEEYDRLLSEINKTQKK